MYEVSLEQWFDWSLYVMIAVFIGLGLFSLPGNFVVIFLTIREKSLRAIGTNWLVFNLATADLLMCFFMPMAGVLSLYPNSAACTIGAASVVCAATISFYIVALIALSRYLYVYHNKLHDKLFSPVRAVLVNIACWLFQVTVMLPILFTGGFAPSSSGMCTLEPNSNSMTNIYTYTVIIPLMVASYVIVVFCYRKLSLWIKQQQMNLNTIRNAEIQNTIKETNALLKMMQWVCVLPAVLQMPLVAMIALREFYTIPMWLSRLTNPTWFLTCFLNPWITLVIVRPYKKAFAKSKLGKLAVFCKCTPTVGPA